MIRLMTFCMLVLGMATTAAAQDKKDVPKELVPFQGTWKVVKAERDGMPAPANEVESIRLKFEGNKLTVKEGKREKADTGSYSVDPKKEPAEIDLVSPDGDKIGGIYKFDKDGKLTLTFVKGKAAARPKKFDDKDAVMMVLEKVKE
jgi:uncharacterized protein (TIGR03067 family)